MNTLEILKVGRAKIADINCFTKGASARNSKGKAVHGESPEACQWCSIGAVYSVIPSTKQYMADGACDILRPFMGGCIINYNDSHTHAEVLSKWDEAIASFSNVEEEMV